MEKPPAKKKRLVKAEVEEEEEEEQFVLPATTNVNTQAVNDSQPANDTQATADIQATEDTQATGDTQTTVETEVAVDTQATDDAQVTVDTQASVNTQTSVNKSDRRVSFAPTKEKVQSRQQEETSDQQKKKEPRLVMKKMVLNDFKSYAGRQVIGPFHKSFSAIVGPNGSGKSNVIDALLFVFGYRANKMRQGKLSELIHNSANHPNCQNCSVEIHFEEIIDGDTPTDFTVVPNSRLVISRQASRNNSSKYSINGRTSTFTEVTTLLKSRGIDLDHKRFLILQGEVESIALMKAKAKDGSDDGLLEYLEDIIGTSKYKEPIEEATTRFEEVTDDRTEKLNRVKYIAKEMDAMEGKKAEAEAYLEKENAVTLLRNKLFFIYKGEAMQNIAKSTRSINQLNETLAEEAKEFETYEKEKEEMNKQYQEIVQKYNGVKADMNKIVKQQTKVEKDVVELRERRDHLVEKQEKGKATLESDRIARTAAQDAIKKNTEELKKRKLELVDLEKQFKEEEKKLEEINQELKGKTDGYLIQIEQHQKKLAPWTEKINEKQKQIDVKKSESELLVERIESGEKAVKEAEEQVKKLTELITQKRKEIKDLPKKIKESTVELKELETFLKSITTNEAQKRTEMNTARQKADEARASMRESQSRGKVLDNILRLRDSGRIEGIYDRLGSLGVIDDRYDVAISTACPALDNIVVETVEAGQACIEYLRKNNLGRAVFTVLGQLRHQNMKEIDTPENVPRLFDLIEPKDKKFKPAFYSVLQDTLVAEDMRQANRIAYGQKRWRVVTMDGKLIERSGAMTGGGNRQLKGAMSSTFKEDGTSAEVVAELERARDQIEKEHKNIMDEKRATETALRRKQEYLPKLELGHEKLQMDIQSIESQLEDENERLERLREETQPSQADVDNQAVIQEEIEQLQEEMAELKEKTVEIEETIKSLHEEIMDAGGMDLRLQKICVNDVRKRIDSLNNRITKNMVAKAKAEKDVSKLETAIVKFERNSEKIEKDIKELNDEIKGYDKDIAEIQAKVDEAKKVMDEKKSKMDEVKKELDEKSAKMNKLRQSEVEAQGMLADFKKSLNDNERKAAHWDEQRSKLELQRVYDEPDEYLKLPSYEGEQLTKLMERKQKIKVELVETETAVDQAKPNLSILEEYRRRRVEYNSRSEALAEATSKRDKVKEELESLRNKRLDEFMGGFNIISQKLKEMYQMITMGGNAELELVDSLDPFSEGIVFSVMPPKKSWKNISNLSGGEKTLSSLALVFALHHFKPTPLYVMDEIDAALDFRNVSIVANYIAERTKDAQFVIISLRNNMFELADRLVGIYKTSNCTKSIAINPNMIAMVTELPTNAAPGK